MTNIKSKGGKVVKTLSATNHPEADKAAAQFDNRAGRRARARIQRKAQPPAAETTESEETDAPTDDSPAL